MHMVVFSSPEGKPAYHQAESLDEALKFVERLRNNEGVEEAKLYALTEIPLQVRTYVKVEIAGAPADEEPPEPGVVTQPSAVAGF